MIAAVMILWVLGAVLMLTCPALIFSERLSVILSRPRCAACGYDLTGLDRSDRCPECNGDRRSFTRNATISRDKQAVVGLWLGPGLFGLVLGAFAGVFAQLPTMSLVIGAAGITGTYLLAGVIARVMVRWMTLPVAWLLLVLSIVAMTLALVGVLLMSVYLNAFAAKTKDIFVISPLLVIPFSGYGLAAGLYQRWWVHHRRGRAFSPAA